MTDQHLAVILRRIALAWSDTYPRVSAELMELAEALTAGTARIVRE